LRREIASEEEKEKEEKEEEEVDEIYINMLERDLNKQTAIREVEEEEEGGVEFKRRKRSKE
jgi:hypothetical protein